jgi:hypothetical protein
MSGFSARWMRAIQRSYVTLAADPTVDFVLSGWRSGSCISLQTLGALAGRK